MMKADAVFQGGGVKAIGLVGAVCRLEKGGIRWQRVAGTSAGAIIASLIAVGYTSNELEDILYNIDFSKFKIKEPIRKIPGMGNILSLLINKGIFKTDYPEKYLKELYKKKGKTKFKDISINGESRLKVIASDVTNKKLLILPDDIKEYGIDPMELEISKAVIMSMSIPFLFYPTKLKYKDKNSYIVDGGITSNYPIWIFDVDGIPRWPTIGFKLNETGKNKILCKRKNSFSCYISDIIDTLLECYDDRFFNERDKIRTINISTLGIKTAQFKISKKDKQELFNEGYNKANKFLDTWNFQDYIRKYRSEK